MAKLTQIALKSLVKKTGRHSDGGGLYFRVLGEGKAYFVYRFTVAGRERETSIGPFPDLSLAEARERHADLRKRVKVDKIDIVGEKRAAKTTVAVPSTKPTFGQMADLHIETHEGSWRNTSRSGGGRSASTPRRFAGSRSIKSPLLTYWES